MDTESALEPHALKHRLVCLLEAVEMRFRCYKDHEDGRAVALSHRNEPVSFFLCLPLLARTKLINWGINRWTFKPEFGYSQRFSDKWILDGYAGAVFFTRNQEFYSIPTPQPQTKSPYGSFEGHADESFVPDGEQRMWRSLARMKAQLTRVLTGHWLSLEYRMNTGDFVAAFFGKGIGG